MNDARAYINRWTFVFRLILLVFLFAENVYAAPPEGKIEQITTTKLTGWAKDADSNLPIRVHIYIDDVIYDGIVADRVHKNGRHGFEYSFASLGAGMHKITAFALGVDADGKLDHQPVKLKGSDSLIKGDCSVLKGVALEWCRGNPTYWVQRQKDTKMLFNDNVAVGINNSYGGTIFQLYGKDRTVNLLSEHGGAAMQLSLWGYQDMGLRSAGGWFRTDTCDAEPHKNRSGEGGWRNYGAANGAQVVDCKEVKFCARWGAGAPWNPIQAQALDCKWNGPSNDVNEMHGDAKSWHTKFENPVNFTKTNRFDGLLFDQQVDLTENHIEVTYHVDYKGSYVTGAHPQEFPAIFTGYGINKIFYLPEATGVKKLDAATTSPGQVAMPAERWWGVCDETETHCLTFAMFDPIITDIHVERARDEGQAYTAAKGKFNLFPGASYQARIYIFPSKYDYVEKDKSVREIIRNLYDLYSRKPSALSFEKK